MTEMQKQRVKEYGLERVKPTPGLDGALIYERKDVTIVLSADVNGSVAIYNPEASLDVLRAE